MRTHEEIKKGPEHFDEKCMCIEKCFADALACIQKLEETIGNLGRLNGTMHNEAKKGIQELESRLAQVERERDAAVKDLGAEKSCQTCAHDGIRRSSGCEVICLLCENISCPCESCNYKWRGVCEENTKEEK